MRRAAIRHYNFDYMHSHGQSKYRQCASSKVCTVYGPSSVTIKGPKSYPVSCCTGSIITRIYKSYIRSQHRIF